MCQMIVIILKNGIIKMVNLVKLKFECVVECKYEYADDLGRDIAHDILNEWDNGVDYLEWNFIGSELVF